MIQTTANHYTIACFLKFGEKNNILDLYENGTIWMSSLQFIRVCDEIAGDKYEGVHSIDNLPSGIFQIPQFNYEGNYLKMHVRGSYERVLGNIFCLYAISSLGFPNLNDFFIDQKMMSFGSHVLLIKNCPEFISRIRKKLNLMPFNYWTKMVHYYDKDSINGQIGVFQKRNELEYQKEFRIFIDRDEITPFSFAIGSLKQISEIHESEYLIKHLKLSA